MDLQQRTKICQLIEAVILADGVVADEERAYLEGVARKLRMPEDVAYDSIAPAEIGRATNTLRELQPDVQMRALALLVDAAVADGEVRPEERALLLAAAATLGVDAVALEERISRRLFSVRPE